MPHRTLTFSCCRNLVVVVIGVIATTPAYSDEALKARVTEILTTQWNSRKSVEFTEVDYHVNRTRYSMTRTSSTIKVAFDPDGRYAYESFADSPEQNARPREHVLFDGVHFHTVRYFARLPSGDLIDEIWTSSRQRHSGLLEHRMTAFLWLVAPGARPPYAHVADSRSVELEVDRSSKRRLVRVESQDRGCPISIYLDPAYQFNVCRIQTPDAKFSWEASEFRRIDGHWFPVKGRTVGRIQIDGSAGESRTEFTVTDLSVNKPLRYLSFSPPPPTEGAEIIDEPAHTHRVQGNPESRRQLQAKYARANSSRRDGSADQRRSSSEEAPVRVWEALAVLVLCITILVVQHRRRKLAGHLPAPAATHSRVPTDPLSASPGTVR